MVRRSKQYIKLSFVLSPHYLWSLCGDNVGSGVWRIVGLEERFGKANPVALPSIFSIFRVVGDEPDIVL